MPFTAHHLYFEDVEVGQEWESLGRTVTEADIVNFAGLSGDFNPIHMDHEFAKTTPFQKPIAHGLLVLSIAAGLGVQNPLMRTLAFVSIREWHFRGPVFIGDTVRVRAKIIDAHSEADGLPLAQRLRLDSEKAALVGVDHDQIRAARISYRGHNVPTATR